MSEQEAQIEKMVQEHVSDATLRGIVLAFTGPRLLILTGQWGVTPEVLFAFFDNDDCRVFKLFRKSVSELWRGTSAELQVDEGWKFDSVRVGKLGPWRVLDEPDRTRFASLLSTSGTS